MDDLPYAGVVKARRGFLEPTAEEKGPDIVREELEHALAEAVGDE